MNTSLARGYGKQYAPVADRARGFLASPGKALYPVLILFLLH